MPRFHPTCHDRQEGKAQLGDVIVADSAWDFQSGKLKIEGRKAKMEFSPHLIPISHFLRGRLEQMTSDRGLVADVLDKFGSDAPNGFKLRIDPIASGAAVMADGRWQGDRRSARIPESRFAWS